MGLTESEEMTKIFANNTIDVKHSPIKVGNKVYYEYNKAYSNEDAIRKIKELTKIGFDTLMLKGSGSCDIYIRRR